MSDTTDDDSSTKADNKIYVTRTKQLALVRKHSKQYSRMAEQHIQSHVGHAVSICHCGCLHYWFVCTAGVGSDNDGKKSIRMDAAAAGA